MLMFTCEWDCFLLLFKQCFFSTYSKLWGVLFKHTVRKIFVGFLNVSRSTCAEVREDSVSKLKYLIQIYFFTHQYLSHSEHVVGDEAREDFIPYSKIQLLEYSKTSPSPSSSPPWRSGDPPSFLIAALYWNGWSECLLCHKKTGSDFFFMPRGKFWAVLT